MNHSGCLILDSNKHFFLHSRDSFTNLSRWLADARALASPHLVAVLVGNKSDRDEEREVEWAEASKWAAENGIVSVQIWRILEN